MNGGEWVGRVWMRGGGGLERMRSLNRDAARCVATKTRRAACGWSGSGLGGHSQVGGQLSARPHSASPAESAIANLAK